MDNLDNINTVQDLLNLQKESITNKETKQLLKEIFTHGPEVGLAIANSIIESLYLYHKQSTERALSNNDTESVCSWAYDEAKLFMAIQALKDVVV